MTRTGPLASVPESALERKGKIARRLEALLRTLLQTTSHGAFESRGKRANGIRHLRRLFFQNGSHGFGRSVAAEGSDAGEHFVKHRPKGKNIGALVGCFAAYLFRRHVSRRAHDDARGSVRTG